MAVPIARLALIAGSVGAAALAFAAVGGVFSNRTSPAHVMQILQAGAGGPHDGFRRNHARGVCATGMFRPSREAAALSRASVFHVEQTPVVARFSLAGGAPFKPDTPGDVRSLALSLTPPGGETWRTAMIVLPIFPSTTPDEFVGLNKATIPGPDGKPVPAAVGAFLKAHPDVAADLGYLKTHPVSTSTFSDATYNSLNSFTMTGPDGHASHVRWSFVADAANPKAESTSGPLYLFRDLLASFAKAPLRWHLMVTIAEPSDPTADPSKPWPDDRKQVDAGILTLDAVQSEDGGACTGITFDPTILPDGIGLSDDPFPVARSSTYARSFADRAAETKPPSAITPAIVAGHGQTGDAQ